MVLDSTLKRQDNLMPQRPAGIGKGTALAILVHVGLLIALAFGVAWRSQTPSGVSAELWAAVPQVAAPPPAAPPKPEPTPTPPQPAPPPKAEEPPKPSQAQIDAQIAIEKEKAERKQRELRELQQREQERKERDRLEREKAEKLEREKAEQEKAERLEREKAEKLAAQKQRELEAKRQKEEAARQAKLREDNLKRMLSQAGTGSPDSPGAAARDAGPSANYAGRIIARVKPNIVLTSEVPGNPLAVVEVRCAPDGTIVGHTLVKSSGSKDWDEAVIRAVERTGMLPRDVDGRVPSPMRLEFRPRDL
ncbi:MAG TPA: cell envelope integrity protein TolA [Burkholderiaceae bacterium]